MSQLQLLTKETAPQAQNILTFQVMMYSPMGLNYSLLAPNLFLPLNFCGELNRICCKRNVCLSITLYIKLVIKFYSCHQ